MMFPLPPNEAAVIAEIFRLFPGTREVTEAGPSAQTPDRTPVSTGSGPVSVTSHQPPLFDNSREAA